MEVFTAKLETFNREKAKIIQSPIYSKDYIADTVGNGISALEEKFLIVVNESCDLLQKILQDEIDETLGKKSGGDNFELQLSNALGFFTMIGDKLNDVTAFSMVQPFFGDYSTMHKLSIALARRDGIQVTLFAVSGYDHSINLLKEMQITYKTIFHNHHKGSATLADGILRTYFMSDVDKYETFIVKLDKYLSCSASDVEKLVSDHSNRIFQATNLKQRENNVESVENGGSASDSRSLREALASKYGNIGGFLKKDVSLNAK